MMFDVIVYGCIMLYLIHSLKKIKDKTARKHDRHPCMQSTLRRNTKHVEVPLEHRTVRVGRVGRVAPTHELRAAGAGETYSRPRSASTSAIPGIRRPETSTLNAHCCHCQCEYLNRSPKPMWIRLASRSLQTLRQARVMTHFHLRML